MNDPTAPPVLSPLLTMTEDDLSMARNFTSPTTSQLKVFAELDAQRARVAALTAALAAAQSEAQHIECPWCGVVVKQVSSATLSLALWQHVNWVCTGRRAALSAPEEPSRREQEQAEALPQPVVDLMDALRRALPKEPSR